MPALMTLRIFMYSIGRERLPPRLVGRGWVT
jgi:hypothetical protein